MLLEAAEVGDADAVSEGVVDGHGLLVFHRPVFGVGVGETDAGAVHVPPGDIVDPLIAILEDDEGVLVVSAVADLALVEFLDEDEDGGGPLDLADVPGLLDVSIAAAERVIDGVGSGVFLAGLKSLPLRMASRESPRSTQSYLEEESWSLVFGLTSRPWLSWA